MLRERSRSRWSRRRTASCARTTRPCCATSSTRHTAPSTTSDFPPRSVERPPRDVSSACDSRDVPETVRRHDGVAVFSLSLGKPHHYQYSAPTSDMDFIVNAIVTLKTNFPPVNIWTILLEIRISPTHTLSFAPVAATVTWCKRTQSILMIICHFM